MSHPHIMDGKWGTIARWADGETVSTERLRAELADLLAHTAPAGADSGLTPLRPTITKVAFDAAYEAYATEVSKGSATWRHQLKVAFDAAGIEVQP